MNTLLVALVVVAVLAVSVNTAALEGPTSDCPDFCTYEYRPVCGYDDSCYRVYGNECTLKSDRCKNRKNLKSVDMDLCDQGQKKSNPDIKMCEDQ